MKKERKYKLGFDLATRKGEYSVFLLFKKIEGVWVLVRERFRKNEK